MSGREYLKVRAVRAEQAGGTSVFAFFLYGADVCPSSEHSAQLAA